MTGDCCCCNNDTNGNGSNGQNSIAELVALYLPIANVPANTQHELLNNSVKDMCQREERQEAVIRAHPDVTQVHKPLQRGHGCHQGVVSQHHTLRVACKEELQPQACHAGMLHVSIGQAPSNQSVTVFGLQLAALRLQHAVNSSTGLAQRKGGTV